MLSGFCAEAVWLKENRKRTFITFPGQASTADCEAPGSTFFYPDYTVDPGVAPGRVALVKSQRYSWVLTTDREFHPAPKACFIFHK